MGKSNIYKCPICDSFNLEFYMEAQDHYYSHETFQILKCDSCKLGITSPQPGSSEIERYYNSSKYISHQVKSTRPIDRLYRFAQRINFQSKRKVLKPVHHGMTVLDYGAGSGAYIKYLREYGYHAIGIEPSKAARENAKELGVELYDVEYINQISYGSIDRITMWHVLEHIHDLKGLISNLSSILSENGRFVIAVPNYRSKDAEMYREFWAALDVPRHLWHFTDQALELLFQPFGFKLIKMKPLKLDAFYVSILSEKYRGGSFIQGIINGMKSNLAHSKYHGYSSNIFIFSRSKWL